MTVRVDSFNYIARLDTTRLAWRGNYNFDVSTRHNSTSIDPRQFRVSQTFTIFEILKCQKDAPPFQETFVLRSNSQYRSPFRTLGRNCFVLVIHVCDEDLATFAEFG